MSEQVRLNLNISIAELAPHHSAVKTAVQELMDDVRETPGLYVSTEGRAAEGTKGWLDTLAVTVGGPSGAIALVRIFRLWLARDRKRSVQIQIEQSDEQPITVDAKGENVSLDFLQRAIEASLKINGKKK